MIPRVVERRRAAEEITKEAAVRQRAGNLTARVKGHAAVLAQGVLPTRELHKLHLICGSSLISLWLWIWHALPVLAPKTIDLEATKCGKRGCWTDVKGIFFDSRRWIRFRCSYDSHPSSVVSESGDRVLLLTDSPTTSRRIARIYVFIVGSELISPL